MRALLPHRRAGLRAVPRGAARGRRAPTAVHACPVLRAAYGRALRPTARRGPPPGLARRRPAQRHKRRGRLITARRKAQGWREPCRPARHSAGPGHWAHLGLHASSAAAAAGCGRARRQPPKLGRRPCGRPPAGGRRAGFLGGGGGAGGAGRGGRGGERRGGGRSWGGGRRRRRRRSGRAGRRRRCVALPPPPPPPRNTAGHGRETAAERLPRIRCAGRRRILASGRAVAVRRVRTDDGDGTAGDRSRNDGPPF